jgi:hypothetical protein
MDRAATPRQKAGYETADLDGEFMIYHSGEGRAVYLNETASLVWKLCDGTRSLAAIEALLGDAYPDAEGLSTDVDDAIRVLLEHGVLEIP